MTASETLAQEDLDYMFGGLGESAWQWFQHKRIFISGGTGFVGSWLLDALIDANQRLSLGMTIQVLSRHPDVFASRLPHLAHAAGVTLLEGDVRRLENVRTGELDLVIHAATDVIRQNSPVEVFSQCVDGTQQMLSLVRRTGAKDLLLTSSGAVYGRQPSDLARVPEVHTGAPDITSPSSAYGEGKRVSEWLSLVQGNDLSVKIARIYVLVGPRLAMDKQFAIGNFIADALAGRDIVIKGDGTPLRSYLYMADTVIWLLAMLVRGASHRVWNLGGDEVLSIHDLAKRVSGLLESTGKITVLKSHDPMTAVDQYIPDVSRARAELAVPTPISLDDAILRTVKWVKSHRAVSHD